VRLLLPQNKILAGIWGYAGDPEKAKERFGGTPPDSLVSSLAQALEQIGQWHDAALASEPLTGSALDPA
jgi:hypothetical protein